MRITRYTDYSVRVLAFLAICSDRPRTIQQIADSYEISRNHLMKVVHQLNKKGYVETIRGKKGGIRLRMQPKDINIGVLVRETENDLSVVECLSSKNSCRITPICGLKGMFSEATTSFLTTLDQYTLEDVIPQAQQPQILRLLKTA